MARGRSLPSAVHSRMTRWRFGGKAGEGGRRRPSINVVERAVRGLRTRRSVVWARARLGPDFHLSHSGSATSGAHALCFLFLKLGRPQKGAKRARGRRSERTRRWYYHAARNTGRSCARERHMRACRREPICVVSKPTIQFSMCLPELDAPTRFSCSDRCAQDSNPASVMSCTATILLTSRCGRSMHTPEDQAIRPPREASLSALW